MAEPPRALPRWASSPFDPAHDASPDRAEGASPPRDTPVDFERTAALSADALRAMACSSPDPGARLAAIWRTMIRDQAIPKGPPGEGLRLVTLLNLATQQDLVLLEGLLDLDPSSVVRAQAALLIWRVARDRDRVVSGLLSRLGTDRSPGVVVQLLTLSPPLPFERSREVVQQLVGHRALEVRRAAWQYWLDNGGALDEAVTRFVCVEPDRELRAACLRRWAESPDHAGMLRACARHPAAANAVMEALREAGRMFQLATLLPLLEETGVIALLRLATGPYDTEDRRSLVGLTGLVQAGGATPGRGGSPYREAAEAPRRRTASCREDSLWHHLKDAYTGKDAPPLTAEERGWIEQLEASFATVEAEEPAAFDDAMEDDDDWWFPDEEIGYRAELVRLMRAAPGG